MDIGLFTSIQIDSKHVVEIHGESLPVHRHLKAEVGRCVFAGILEPYAELAQHARAWIARLHLDGVGDLRTADLARDSIVFHGVAELQGRATYDAQLAAQKMASAMDGVRDVADHAVWTAAV